MLNDLDLPTHSTELRKGISLNFEAKTEIKLKKFSSIYHNFDSEQSVIANLPSICDSLFKCLKCKKFYYDDESKKRVVLQFCQHQFCKACLIKAVNHNFIKNNGAVKCLYDDCSANLQEIDYKVFFNFFSKVIIFVKRCFWVQKNSIN